MNKRGRLDQAHLLNDLAFRMHLRGWHVDQERRLWHSERLAAQVLEAKTEFAKLAGITVDTGESDDEDDEEFDSKVFGSSKQLQVLFYDKWGVRKRVNPKTGRVTLDKQTLGDLLGDEREHVALAARWLLRFRQAHKTKSTYIDRLSPDSRRAGRWRGRKNAKEWVEGKPNSYLTEGWPEAGKVLRPHWHVIHALTGRWSSAGPNLQNLLKPVIEKDPVTGEKRIVRYGTRDVLIARPEMWLVEGDYSQLELRIIALLSGDLPLLELYAKDAELRKIGKELDMHAENAKTLFELAAYDPAVHKALRDLAKTFVYGSNYGGSVKTVWRQIVTAFPKITEAEVADMQRRWFAAHPAIKAWTTERFQTAKTSRVICEYLSGREFVFYLGHVKRTEPGNYSVQGFAASVTNAATIRVDNELRWEQEALLAQVHDALFLEGPDRVRLCRILKEQMETKVTLNGHEMNFPIDLKVGRAWGLMEEYKQ